MPWLTQLADVARRTGFPVVEVSGWKTRGHGEQPEVQGVVAHHTAGHDDRGVVVYGRPGLDGPLSHFWLEHTGRIHVVAAGRCWHNAPSTSPYHDNSSSLGIEAENNGREPWPDVQVDAYIRLCAELCKEFKLPASRVKGHKEVQIGKPDPHTINMNTFRADVARAMTGDHDMPLSADDLKRIGTTVYDAVWKTDAILGPLDAADHKTNPNWQPQSILKDIQAQVRSLTKTAAAQNAAIKELAAALAAQDAAVDADALVARIEAAIENVTVRLDVPDTTA